MSTESPPANQGPIDPVYEVHINEKWFLGLEHVAVTLLLAMFFCLLNAFPLRPNDLWTHVLHGNWILDHRNLPTTDPFMPLAEGMQVVDSAWLSQVVFALTERIGGAMSISLLFTIVVFTSYVILMKAYQLQAESLSRPLGLLVGLASMAGAVAVGWSRLSTVRPENFGLLCFAGLVWIFVADENRYSSHSGESVRHSHRFSRFTWIGVPLILALWANLHGSFLCGLALLGCFTCGRIIQGIWDKGGIAKAFGSNAVSQAVWLAELGLLATFVNPYGPDLILHSLWFSRLDNLKELLEWQSLSILGAGGRAFAISWVALVIALRYSRKPIPIWHALALALFTYAAVTGIRMLGWYAPVVMMVLTPHIAEIVFQLGTRCTAWLQTTEDEESYSWLEFQRSPHYILVCGLIVFVAFVFSDLGVLVGYKPRSAALRYGNETPLALTEFLEKNEKITQSNIFNPQPWGDWLKWKLGDRFRPFVTSNVHLVPRQAWLDYNRIVNAQPGWQSVLDRYRIDTILVDIPYQPVLYRVLKKDENWTGIYEDEKALVVRRKPSKPRATFVAPSLSSSTTPAASVATPGPTEKQDAATGKSEVKP